VIKENALYALLASFFARMVGGRDHGCIGAYERLHGCRRSVQPDVGEVPSNLDALRAVELSDEYPSAPSLTFGDPSGPISMQGRFMSGC
jgi:hypothetical protein